MTVRLIIFRSVWVCGKRMKFELLWLKKKSKNNWCSLFSSHLPAKNKDQTSLSFMKQIWVLITVDGLSSAKNDTSACAKNSN